jgi:hypothetical protein
MMARFSALIALGACAALLQSSQASPAPVPGPLSDAVCSAALIVFKVVAPTQLAQASTYSTATFTAPARRDLAGRLDRVRDANFPRATPLPQNLLEIRAPVPVLPAVWKTLVASAKSSACTCVLQNAMPTPLTVYTSTSTSTLSLTYTTTVAAPAEPPAPPACANEVNVIRGGNFGTGVSSWTGLSQGTVDPPAFIIRVPSAETRNIEQQLTHRPCAAQETYVEFTFRCLPGLPQGLSIAHIAVSVDGFLANRVYCGQLDNAWTYVKIQAPTTTTANPQRLTFSFAPSGANTGSFVQFEVTGISMFYIDYIEDHGCEDDC